MEQIEKFLTKPWLINRGNGYGDESGYGDGYGNGYGYGDGYGNEYGDSYGCGCGDRYGNGSGRGYGYGNESGNESGIKIFNSQPVYIIDSISTLITSVRNNIAKGFILELDFTLTPCYIVKEGNYFSHGTTLKKAFESLQEKLYQDTPLAESIKRFKIEFPDFKEKYPASKLFVWHNILTGSCKMGRESFARDRNINIQTDSFTVYEFIELTKDSYEGENIKALLD